MDALTERCVMQLHRLGKDQPAMVHARRDVHDLLQNLIKLERDVRLLGLQATTASLSGSEERPGSGTEPAELACHQTVVNTAFRQMRLDLERLLTEVDELLQPWLRAVERSEPTGCFAGEPNRCNAVA